MLFFYMLLCGFDPPKIRSIFHPSHHLLSGLSLGLSDFLDDLETLQVFPCLRVVILHKWEGSHTLSTGFVERNNGKTPFDCRTSTKFRFPSVF